MSGRKNIKNKETVGFVRLSLCALVFMMLALGCANDMQDIHLFDRQTLPDQEIRNAHVRRSESGKLQMELDAPLIRQYHEPTSKTIYPQGVSLRFYGSDRVLKTALTARYAISLDDKEMMEARDSVVVIDYGSGDTVYLDNIIWNSNEDRLYSNRPVKAVNGNRITYGDGFVSDGRMENLRVVRQRGTIEFNE